MKQVKFSENLIYVITFQKNFKYDYPRNNQSWYLGRKHNRKLRRIERYMRAVHLLNWNEYLELNIMDTRHIRGDYINFISRERGWIKNREYLKVVI